MVNNEITTLEVNAEERDNILRAEEGHFLDFKSKSIKPGKLTETLSAFANTAGGELYIGIPERKRSSRRIRKWVGFSDQESANGHLQAFEEIFPLSSSFSYLFLRCDGCDGLVLKADIHKVKEIKKASSGIPYVRRGAQNLPVNNPQKLKQLEFNKGIVSFENEFTDTDIDLIEGSNVLRDFLKYLIPTPNPTDFLHKQQLVMQDKPTVAATLLFSDEPQAILPKHCGIKILRYRTRETLGDRDTLTPEIVTVEGSMYNCIKETVSKVSSLVEETPVLGPGRLISIVYPHETLHEIITNAVCKSSEKTGHNWDNC